jgi:hypothetical protein
MKIYQTWTKHFLLLIANIGVDFVNLVFTITASTWFNSDLERFYVHLKGVRVISILIGYSLGLFLLKSKINTKRGKIAMKNNQIKQIRYVHPKVVKVYSKFKSKIL